MSHASESMKKNCLTDDNPNEVGRRRTRLKKPDVCIPKESQEGTGSLEDRQTLLLELLILYNRYLIIILV